MKDVRRHPSTRPLLQKKNAQKTLAHQTTNALFFPVVPLAKGSVMGKKLARTGFSAGQRTAVTSQGTATPTQAAAMTLIDLERATRLCLTSTLCWEDSWPTLSIGSTSSRWTFAAAIKKESRSVADARRVLSVVEMSV